MARQSVCFSIWLNDRMATTRLANVTVIIIASNTVIQHHPLSDGNVPTTLEKAYSIALKLYYLPSDKNIHSIFKKETFIK